MTTADGSETPFCPDTTHTIIHLHPLLCSIASNPSCTRGRHHQRFRLHLVPACRCPSVGVRACVANRAAPPKSTTTHSPHRLVDLFSSPSFFLYPPKQYQQQLMRVMAYKNSTQKKREVLFACIEMLNAPRLLLLPLLLLCIYK